MKYIFKLFTKTTGLQLPKAFEGSILFSSMTWKLWNKHLTHF